MKNLLTIFLLIMVQFAFGQSGSIQGTVTDEQNNKLKEILVTIEKNGIVISKTETNSNGKYIFDNLETDIYYISVLSRNYIQKEVAEVILFEGKSLTINLKLETTELKFTYLSTSRKIDKQKIIYNYKPKINRYEQAKIKGKIVVENQNLAGFSILIKKTNQIIYEVKTDTLGKFSIENIPLGIYNIEVQKQNYETILWEDFKMDFNSTFGHYQISFEPQRTLKTYFDSYFSISQYTWFSASKIHFDTTQNTTFTADEIQRSPIKN